MSLHPHYCAVRLIRQRRSLAPSEWQLLDDILILGSQAHLNSSGRSQYSGGACGEA